jgi:hypothetical protein
MLILLLHFLPRDIARKRLITTGSGYPADDEVLGAIPLKIIKDFIYLVTLTVPAIEITG